MHFFNDSAILFLLALTKHQMIFVLVAAVAQWLLGILWYGVIFRKSWKALVGFTGGAKQKNAAFGMIIAFVACMLLSFVMSQFLNFMAQLASLGGSLGPTNFTSGITLGVVCWLGFMAPPLFTQHIYENRRANLFAINAGYWLLAMAIGGGILAAFHG